MNFDGMSSEEYDEVLNEIALALNTSDEDDKNTTRMMLWGLINILINKNVVTQEEMEDSVAKATTFYKLLERRKKIQENTSVSSEPGV